MPPDLTRREELSARRVYLMMGCNATDGLVSAKCVALSKETGLRKIRCVQGEDSIVLRALFVGDMFCEGEKDQTTDQFRQRRRNSPG